jgi:hypothetical protein
LQFFHYYTSFLAQLPHGGTVGVFVGFQLAANRKIMANEGRFGALEQQKLVFMSQYDHGGGAFKAFWKISLRHHLVFCMFCTTSSGFFTIFYKKSYFYKKI